HRLADEGRGELRLRHPDAPLVSAETGEGLEELRSRIAGSIGQGLTEVELLIPFDAGERLSGLQEIAGDPEREYREEGVRVRARLPAALAHRFEDLEIDGRGPRGGRG